MPRCTVLLSTHKIKLDLSAETCCCCPTILRVPVRRKPSGWETLVWEGPCLLSGGHALASGSIRAGIEDCWQNAQRCGVLHRHLFISVRRTESRGRYAGSMQSVPALELYPAPGRPSLIGNIELWQSSREPAYCAQRKLQMKRIWTSIRTRQARAGLLRGIGDSLQPPLIEESNTLFFLCMTKTSADATSIVRGCAAASLQPAWELCCAWDDIRFVWPIRHKTQE